MKILISFILLKIITAKKEQFNPQGYKPTKSYIDCCPGLEKVLNKDFLDSCQKRCENEKEVLIHDDKDNDHCCIVHYLAHETGILKDGIADENTAIESLSKIFDNDEGWVKVSSVYK